MYFSSIGFLFIVFDILAGVVVVVVAGLVLASCVYCHGRAVEKVLQIKRNQNVHHFSFLYFFSSCFFFFFAIRLAFDFFFSNDTIRDAPQSNAFLMKSVQCAVFHINNISFCCLFVLIISTRYGASVINQLIHGALCCCTGIFVLHAEEPWIIPQPFHSANVRSDSIINYSHATKQIEIQYIRTDATLGR